MLADQSIIDMILHVDETLVNLIRDYGSGTYAILWGIIFCETGLVVMPFLPGDSLLFAAGLFARPGKGLDIVTLLLLLPTASIIGDSVNFHIGKFFGKRLFKSDDARIFKKSHLNKTKEFFDHYGAKTIIIGRFVPVVRTLAPFVAGMEVMTFKRFFPLSIMGAYIWVFSCTLAGYFFGGIPWVERNFEKVILIIVGLSLLLIVKEFIGTLRKDKMAKKSMEEAAVDAEPLASETNT